MWTVFQLFPWPEQVHVVNMVAIKNIDCSEKMIIRHIMDNVWKSCLVTFHQRQPITICLPVASCC
jgi:hypothetical protein